jgi:hypothetical protein
MKDVKVREVKLFFKKLADGFKEMVEAQRNGKDIADVVHEERMLRRRIELEKRRAKEAGRKPRNRRPKKAK